MEQMHGMLSAEGAGAGGDLATIAHARAAEMGTDCKTSRPQSVRDDIRAWRASQCSGQFLAGSDANPMGASVSKVAGPIVGAAGGEVGFQTSTSGLSVPASPLGRIITPRVHTPRLRTPALTPRLVTPRSTTRLVTPRKDPGDQGIALFVGQTQFRKPPRTAQMSARRLQDPNPVGTGSIAPFKGNNAVAPIPTPLSAHIAGGKTSDDDVVCSDNGRIITGERPGPVKVHCENARGPRDADDNRSHVFSMKALSKRTNVPTFYRKSGAGKVAHSNHQISTLKQEVATLRAELQAFVQTATSPPNDEDALAPTPTKPFFNKKKAGMYYAGRVIARDIVD